MSIRRIYSPPANPSILAARIPFHSRVFCNFNFRTPPTVPVSPLAEFVKILVTTPLRDPFTTSFKIVSHKEEKFEFGGSVGGQPGLVKPWRCGTWLSMRTRRRCWWE